MSLQTDRERVAHLLRRFGLGCSEAELDYYAKDGVKGAIDRLLGFAEVPVIGDWDPAVFANKQGVVNIRVAQGLWYARVLATARPLEEKMTIFWHNHFATSAEKVDSSPAMMNQISTLRSNCLGKFGPLLEAVSKDPAMIFWLDNNENIAGKPNENFAREVMELFTLGVGYYTEKDVQEAARAFTGWTFGLNQRFVRKVGTAPRRDRFVFDSKNHDGGEKTIFGKTANFGGEDVLVALLKHPQTALAITKKFLEWFATPEPDKAWVERLAKKFSENDLDIKTLVRAIMESEEFYSEPSETKLIKGPMDFCITTARQLGIGARISAGVDDAIANPQINPDNGLNQKALRAITPAFACHQSTDAMGMELFYPPDVSGWKAGASWITTSTMVERIKWADRLYIPALGAARPQPGAGPGNRNPSLGYDAFQIIGGISDPKEVVAKLVGVFDARVGPGTMKIMTEGAASEMSGVMTRVQANAVARIASRLLFASPDFQFM